MAKQFRIKTWLNAKQVRQAVKQAAIPRLALAALAIEREAKLLMKKGGQRRDVLGRFARGVGRSKPGQPPFVQTGNLRASIKTAKTTIGSYLVGPTKGAPYGKFLEFGTRKMAPRPFMRPALARAKKKLPKLFKNLPLSATPAGARLNAGRGRKL